MLLRNIFIFLVILPTCLFAQTTKKDTVIIDEVQVTTNRQKIFSTGNNVYLIPKSIQKVYASQSISELLSDNSSVTINNYGVNGNASISICGAGANHTAVVWNGVSIQNPLNGGLDLSNVSVAFVDDIAIQHGGSGALYGSSAIGGVLLMNNEFEFSKGFSALFTGGYGSFSNYNALLAYAYSSKRLSLTTRVFYHDSKNDFPFRNKYKYGNPIERLTHAHSVSGGFMQGLSYKLTEFQTVNAYMWIQKRDNELPPLMSNSLSKAVQNDENTRLLGSWDRHKNNVNSTVRLAWLHDKIHYEDPATKQNDTHRSSSCLAEFEHKVTIRKQHILNFGVNNVLEFAHSTKFSGTKVRNRQAGFVSYNWTSLNDRWTSTLNLRNEIVDARKTPLVYSAAMAYVVNSAVKTRAVFSRNYRIPTFNELYWAVWGNPNLISENGWCSSVGVDIYKTIASVKSKFEISGFNNNIDNWIMWIPSGQIWHPMNIQKVWSRGFEQSLKLQKNVADITFVLNQHYTFVRSSKMQDGHWLTSKQLMYVPIHKASVSLTAEYKAISATYLHSLESQRFTTDENSPYSKVAAYNVGNVSIAGTYKQFRCSFKVNNVWNASYQVMSGYAMPMRNYMFSLTIFFNNQKSQTK